ncbi:MAG: hypothetical protein K2X03_26710 [Bryobacteraceae bacterium]|nr:hypothetical protein [Bryobacteraceae bacterium]
MANPYVIAPKANEPIVVASSTEIVLTQGQSSRSGVGTLVLEWLPFPRLHLQLELTAPAADSGPTQTAIGGQSSVELPSLSMKGEAWIGMPSLDFLDPSSIRKFKVNFHEAALRAPDRDLSSLGFHLVNFLSSQDHESKLEDDAWSISLVRSSDSLGLLKDLKDKLGYGLTHYGVLQARTDSQTFKRNDANEVFETLHYLLSFARGRYVSVAMISELNPVPRWDTVGVPHVVSMWPDKSTLSWNPHQNSSPLTALFSGFREAWKNSEKQRLLKRTIFWYVSSNLQAVRTSGGIPLSQVALERLAWQHLVASGKSKTQISKMSTIDQFREFISSLGLPLGIPTILGEISKVAVNVKSIKENGGDLAASLVAVRNNLAHPVDRHGGQLDGHMVDFEAWNAFQWLVELGILKSIGYTGFYRNRLYTQSLEIGPVPWSDR